MVELIPFLLFLLEWHPDRPHDITVTRIEQVFPDEETCELEGLHIYSEAMLFNDVEGKEFDFSCQPMPSREEMDEMIERTFGEQEQ